MHNFIGELHPMKRKKIKQEATSDGETAEHGEEHNSKKKKKKKKMRNEAADGEAVGCGKKVIIWVPCVARAVSLRDSLLCVFVQVTVVCR
jgi:hypothetical protein